ncbi:MAG: CHAT domain-containing protein [Jaaginema sp. PMC 1079.18]|nr:CHAT domain-containing protein [Jaaginema sp. PMC 1080.18]MEC4852596.1 CHAT domain-containing protein [Jaaginema sp. PMC 1079.18]MEC4868563.1 CHAT domain-containing protein [Jaaginema sp. PMC 1078.18]
MAQGKQAIGSVLVMLLAMGSIGVPQVRANSTEPQQLAQQTNEVTGELSENSQILDYGSYFNVHTFNGRAGAKFVIDLMSSDFNAYLIILGPNGKPIAQNDDGGEGTNARLVVTLPVAGTYQILASSFLPSMTGQYRLSLSLMSDGSELRLLETLFPGLTGFQIPFEQLRQQANFPDSSQPSVTDILTRELTNSLPFPFGQLLLEGFQNSPQRVAALDRESVELLRKGYYSEAESRSREVLAILREEVDENHPAIAKGLTSLARVYDFQGRYDEAEPLYQEALAINRKHFGESHPESILSLRILAGTYSNQGRYGEAESLFEEILNLRRGVFGDRHPQVAESLESLAGVYLSLGRYDEAETLYQQALSIYREQREVPHPSIARGLNSLAVIYFNRGRYNEAEAFLKEAIAIKPGIATINNLGEVYQQQGRYAEARNIFEQALSIRREQFGDRSEEVAYSLNNLAKNSLTLGSYDRAVQLAQKGLDIRREIHSNRSIFIAQSLKDLSTVYLTQGNITQAITTLSEGLNIEELNLDLNLATLNDTQRQAYAATLSNTTQKAISLHLQAAPNSPEAARLALTTLLRRKGRVLEAGTLSLQRLRQNLSPEDRETLDRLAQAQRQLSAFIFNPPDNLPPEQYRIRLAELETTVAQLESSLARRSAVFRAEFTPVEIAAVQAQIPSNGVLVEYVRYQPFNARDVQKPWEADRYAAYLLFPDGRIQAVDLGDAAPIDAAVQSFTRLLQDRSADFQRAGAVPTLRPDVVEGVTNTLHTLVFDPIAPYLQNTQHLLISPDSQLNRLPFEALQPETGGDYLVQQYQISYLNSGRDLPKFNLVPSSNNPAIVLANPNYETADNTVQIARTVPDSQENDRSVNERSTELSQLQVRPLPGTAAEAEAIKPLLPNARFFNGIEATENLLKTVQAPRILHIATHGFFLPDIERPNSDRLSLGMSSNNFSATSISPERTLENPLLRSGLALAGFNNRNSGNEDGVLTALEASNLNLLGTQLVVLSACETGLGDIANGEGVYGLRRAFALAGAQTQLMSLWQVSDFGTKNLMARYYQKLNQGMGTSEALRSVQLEMIANGGNYSHPYYWAAFVLAGDWRPLE